MSKAFLRNLPRILAVLIGLVVMLPARTALAAYESEPNTDQNQANSVRMGEYVYGAYDSGYGHTVADYDFFSFYAPINAKATVTLCNENYVNSNYGNINFTVYDQYHEKYYKSENSALIKSTKPVDNTFVLRQGTNYIEIGVPKYDINYHFIVRYNMSEAQASGITTRTYNGRAHFQSPAISIRGTKLNANTDYTISHQNNTNAGAASVIVTGKGMYVGSKTFYFQINKIGNRMEAKGKTIKVKASKVRRKSKTFPAKKAFAVSNATGKVTYKKLSGNKKISVTSSGKIKLKKGIKKGTYKIKVKVHAAGNANYGSIDRNVTVTVRVR